MPVVEFLTFNVSEAYAADSSLVRKLIDLLTKTDGYITSFCGTQQEDTSKGYIAIIWETYEHHAALTQAPSYPEVVQAFGLLVAEPLPSNSDMLHINFTPDPIKAISAPTTEIALLTLKQGKEQKDLDDEMITLAKSLDKAKGSHPPCSWGLAREKPNLTVLLVGWDTAQAHMDSVYGPSGFPDVIEGVGKVADVTFTHTSFKKL